MLETFIIHRIAQRDEENYDNEYFNSFALVSSFDVCLPERESDSVFEGLKVY